MTLQIFGFLIDERLKNLLLFSLLALALTLIMTAVVFPEVMEYDVKKAPSDYAFYRGYCDSRTSQCSDMRNIDPDYDCSYLCDVCNRVGETAYKTCMRR